VTRRRRRGGRATAPLASGGDEPGLESHGLDLERIVFLSDGVFAIAMTLLVLEIRLPALPENPTSEVFGAALGSVVPRVLAYALSFVVLATYWLAHWRRFHLIRRGDDRLALLNLLQLGLIALIPFPTAVMGEHGDQPLAVVLYAVTLSAAGIAGTAVWVYTMRARLLEPGTGAETARRSAARSLIVPGVMLASLVLLPFAGPPATELSWLLIIPAMLVLRLRRQSAR
jgi:uncharacterized membrane protein